MLQWSSDCRALQDKARSDAVVKGGDVRREKTMILAAVQIETNTFVEQKSEDLKGLKDGLNI